MEFQFVFKQMDSSDSVKEYVQNKLTSKLQKLVTKPIEVQFTFYVDKYNHTASCVLVGGDGFDIQAEYTDKDLYAAIDKTIDKLITQIKKQKSKIKDHKPIIQFRTVENTMSNALGKINTRENSKQHNEDEKAPQLDAEYVIKYEKMYNNKK